ncbi:MAG: hypothetical protein CVU38_19665 [Chloroflexi bacterium HGW-Chloroflexi-1]|nr:MAG: hypothetical protein CVU38_19665 [Chloroflexi bacterium HGW-Chloroflexi-1]
MIAIDSDVLAVHHIFTGDTRYSENARFMERSVQHERGVTIYNLLELCGIVASAGRVAEAKTLFQRYLTAADMQVLYPAIHLESLADYWASHNEELMKRIERGMRLGDAVVLWVAESVNCNAVVTWNKRHFEGKTSLQLYTPTEWLKVAGYT